MVHLFVHSDNFYENLKKLRLEDNFIVKSISTTLLNRVSRPNICPGYLFFLRLSRGVESSEMQHVSYMPALCDLSNLLSLCSFSLAKWYKFEGTEGEWFQKLTARFCSHQSWALDQIKNRQKKDPRFNSFILVQAWT